MVEKNWNGREGSVLPIQIFLKAKLSRQKINEPPNFILFWEVTKKPSDLSKTSRLFSGEDKTQI